MNSPAGQCLGAGVSAGPAQSVLVNHARQRCLSSLGRAVKSGKWSGSVETMLCSSWGRGRACCQATGSAAPVPMAASTSAEAGLLMEHPTRGCSLLGGPPSLPRAWGARGSHAGRRGGVPPSPARERGRETGPFSPPDCPVPTIPMGTLQLWCWSVLLRNRSLLPRVCTGVGRSCSFGSGAPEGCPMFWSSSGSLISLPKPCCNLPHAA